MAVQVSRHGSEIIVVITETSAGASTEATIPIGIKKGRVLRQMCDLTSGSGATVDPILGIDTNPAGNNVIVENGTAGDPIDNVWSGGVSFACQGTLYHRSNVNSGSDNAISTTYHILVGWGS